MLQQTIFDIQFSIHFLVLLRKGCIFKSFEMFKIPKKCLKMTGNLNLDKIPPIVFKILRVFLNAFVSYCLFATVLYIMRNFDDVGEVAEAFALGLTALLSLTKMLTFYKSKQKFYDFMKRSEDMTDECKKL